MSDFNALKFVADNAGLNIFKALEKAYEQGKADANHPEIPDSSDAISRQDAIEAINLWLYCDKDERTPADVIKALPAVQTEIIHCKDCLYKKICSWKNQGAEFCSFGERGKQDDSD